MAKTLLEAAKAQRNPLVAGIVQIFAQTSPVLELVPVVQIAGTALEYNREGALPGVGFRGVNEDYTATHGVINPQTEALKIFGGKAGMDRFLAKTAISPENARVSTMEKFAKAIALDFTKYFFDGDSASDPREFDGLNRRLSGGTQELEAGANGAPLTLALLDEAIDLLHGTASVLFMSKLGRRQLGTLSRAAGSGLIADSRDMWGRPVLTYAGIPIRVPGEDADGAEILDADETQGTDAATHSIYAVRFGASDYEDVQVIANTATPDHEDLGLAGTTSLGDLIEWYASQAMFHGKAAARLKGLAASLT
jgi:hypothetical protein